MKRGKFNENENEFKLNKRIPAASKSEKLSEHVKNLVVEKMKFGRMEICPLFVRLLTHRVISKLFSIIARKGEKFVEECEIAKLYLINSVYLVSLSCLLSA